MTLDWASYQHHIGRIRRPNRSSGEVKKKTKRPKMIQSRAEDKPDSQPRGMEYLFDGI